MTKIKNISNITNVSLEMTKIKTQISSELTVFQSLTKSREISISEEFSLNT